MPRSQKKIRLGTRASKLAMWQSQWVRSQLQGRGVIVDLVPIKTAGDVKTEPLSQIGGQGLFTKRLQDALLNEQIDLAVHSLKDLPTEDHPELTVAAIPERENAADVLVANRTDSFKHLPVNSVVGTGSVRRAAQLLHLRKDLQIRDIRGNVDTRLKKLDEQKFDAIVLAAAGLMRLGLANRITYCFSTDEMMPAVGQGALGLETRADDQETIQVLQPLNDPVSFHGAMAERSMLRRLFAGCLAPVGAPTMISGNALTLEGIVLSRDGRVRIQAKESAALTNATDLGTCVAEMLLSQGADRLLQRNLEP